MAAPATKKIGYLAIILCSLILMVPSLEVWGASGTVTIDEPSVNPYEATGDFTVEGTYIMSEDETPT
ncbi:MAG: hypothetical protein JRI89_00665, partial [Deltaproteobacteria bacterium]|nr:hypothetical protein [Deltaproteobacteria bacterium]